MNLTLKILSVLLLIGVVFYSCKKELSCEGCINGIKPPIAKAGPDQVITLPMDSVLLDGSTSNDPDGKISGWLWTKILGPVSFIISNSSTANTVVKNLVAGIYQFELKVTDNKGLSAKDTVQISVIDPGQPNRPPVANAGSDQTITLPWNSVNLDGSSSTDPDNNISIYAWTKISGPSSFSIVNANSVQTQATNLIEGIYRFELKVTDASGLFSKDTVQIIVNTDVIIACDGSIRPQVNAQLIPFAVLSVARQNLTLASAGNKILFAGGFTLGSNSCLSSVDIFDITTNTWTTSQLSSSRCVPVTAISQNKIFLSGIDYNGNSATTADVYDAISNTWSTLTFPHLTDRGYLDAATAAGNKVLFLSGSRDRSATNNYTTYSFVDIYNISTNTWRTDTLHKRTHTFPHHSFSDAGVAATAIGNKIYFAGNASDYWAWDFGSISSTIDIYDASTDTWSGSNLDMARGYMAAIAVGSKNYWAGGLYEQPQFTSGPFTNKVEIRDMNTGSSTFGCLFQPNGFFSAVLKNNKIVFFTSGINAQNLPEGPHVTNKFDIYDIATNSWSVGVLPVTIEGASIISVNNTIYVAGGKVNGILSNQVWKLEF